ncbi:MAG TPA: phosphoribosylformylglycinamidine synthase subunit PurL [Pyrinomonadaceae bacterium]|jgi:phosphoribosylformylglycinamidine synthase|nr:phosphoribosylformylglycinamidine synthase subunit PurL [Pyrinomonadaceae bacterium]
MITAEVLTAHNLTPDEFTRIKELLGREPNLVELGVFSVMWSEHCSYKSSRIHLKRLPTQGERVIVPPGENAGIVDVGDGWCAAFKIESHNHPSFIEPFQGAATGVGGILRDIFTMGARPVAALNSLRFGSLDDPKNGRRNRSLLAGVVAGIAHYGNAFGVPTVGGEVAFDDAYALNPLVNAFALGLVRKDQIFFGKATGVGNPVLYVGAKTGRDGIHGATMASAEFDEEALEKRPTVQVGDPFLEKLLLEACLEAMRSGAIAGIQDMGAAGLTCSTCEMAARADTGIEIDLSLVPQRETGMTAYEMLLSESQERMLIVAHKGRSKEIVEIFAKWDLDAVVIGHVRDDGRMRVMHEGEIVCDVPVKALTDEAPIYERPKSQVQSPKSHHPTDAKDQSTKTKDQNYNEALMQLLASPNLASKEWVYRQYDHMVRTNTVVLPGADAAVVRIKETRKALAIALDGNGRYCAINPREAAKLIVAEAARNVVCVGAKPIAITNCLNFASPERLEVMWSFSEVIDGMAEACRAFNTPVVSGNVSFYNETEGRGVLPTPVIGMVGLIEDVKRVIQPGFKTEGDIIALLGETHNDLSLSEYSVSARNGNSTVREGTKTLAGRRPTVREGSDSVQVPKLDLNLELAVQAAGLRAAEAGLLKSAHDCSDGGLAVALAESCFSSLNRQAMGVEISLKSQVSSLQSPTSLLFSESPSRIIISFAESDQDEVERIAAAAGAPFTILGTVGSGRLRIEIDGEEMLNASVKELEHAWRSSLEQKLQAEAMAAGAE